MCVAERAGVHASVLRPRRSRLQDDRKHKHEWVAHQGKSHGMNPHITGRRVETAADRKECVDLAFRLNAGDPNWVPPLKQDVYDLITPSENPWFGHAEAQLFVAERDAIGRAHV